MPSLCRGSLPSSDVARARSRFYDEGYEDGFAHGRIHGLIEGRALGREKGYEMFEELGFYQGFGLTWKKIYESTGRSEEFVCFIVTPIPDGILIL